MAIAIGLTISCCLTYYATMINNLNVAYYSKLDRASSLLSQIPLVYKYLVKKESAHQNLIFVITLTALGLSLRFTSTLFFHLAEPVLFVADSTVTMNSISPLYNISGWTGGFTENNTGIQSLTQYMTNNNRTLLERTIKIDRVPFVNDSSVNNSIPYARNIIGVLFDQLEPSDYFDTTYTNITGEFSDGNTTMFATLFADANAVFPYADLRLLSGLLLTSPDDSDNGGIAPYVWASPSMLLWQSSSSVYPYMSVKDSGLYAHNPTNSTLIIVSKNSAVSICTPFHDDITAEQCLRGGVSMEETFIQKCSVYFNRTKTASDHWESLCVEWREQDGAYTINIIDFADSYKKLQITYNMYYSGEVRQILDPKKGFTPLSNLGESTYTGDILFLQQLFVQNPANVTHAGSHQIGVYTSPFDNDLVNEPFLESLLDWFGAGCSLTDCDDGQMVLEYASGYEGTGLLIATCVSLMIAICTLPLNWMKKYNLFNQHIIDTVSRTIDYSNDDSSSNWNREFYHWRLTTGDELHMAVAINDLGQLTAKKLSEVEVKESTPLNDYKA